MNVTQVICCRSIVIKVHKQFRLLKLTSTVCFPYNVCHELELQNFESLQYRRDPDKYYHKMTLAEFDNNMTNVSNRCC